MEKGGVPILARSTTDKTREDMAVPLSLAMYSIILDAGKQEENEELSEIFYDNAGNMPSNTLQVLDRTWVMG